MRRALLVLAAGCGRFGFVSPSDAPPDAAVQIVGSYAAEFGLSSSAEWIALMVTLQ